MDLCTQGISTTPPPVALALLAIPVAHDVDIEVQALSLEALRMVFTAMREDLLRFLIRRTGNAALAADLTQDIFEKLPSIRACIPNEQKARAYLYRIAGNLAIDHIRVEGRRAELLNTSYAFEERCEPSTEQLVILQDEIRQVDSALRELPDNVRQVLLLLRIDGLPHKEVATRLGISVSQVEKHQSRALSHCRARLGVHASLS